MTRFLTAAAFAFVPFVAPAMAADSIPAPVAAAVSDPGRPPDDRARDDARKPSEVVAFSRIKPGDHIAELSPFGGYYTRILSKLVGSKGAVYTIVPNIGWRPQQSAEQRKALQDQLGVRGDPRAPVVAALAIADVTDYHNVTVLWEPLDQFGAQFAVPEQLDAVWTSDNYHDYKNKNYGPLDTAGIDKAIFAALKPGGIYFVVDHAAAPGTGFTVTASQHRADEAAVKGEVLAAGFVLDGESKALANPADDHSKPIFDASLRGHTDQFILRFKKPATAPSADPRPPLSAMNGYFGNTNLSAKGMPTERHILYHPDHTYQEYGMPNLNPVQQGDWFFDTAGHVCTLLQFPVESRNNTACHANALNKKAGETWDEDTYGSGSTRQHSIVAGYVYPPAASAGDSKESGAKQ